MRVSFIVPLYNCLPFTQEMLGSLRATVPDGLDHEIILVDDGSTDGTRGWLATLGAPFRIILNERNSGYAAANNRGAAVARGDLLVFLNNDLVLSPGWLGPMLGVHARLGPRAGLVGNVQLDARTGRVDHAGIAFNHKGKPEHVRGCPPAPLRILFPMRRVAALTGACFLVSGALWRRLGGFDEGYVNGCEDVDLCLKALASGMLNAVALRSRIRHHVSMAPGRKARDEANTFRFTLRWRETLVLLALRSWCRHHLSTFARDRREFPDPILAWRIVLYLLRAGRRPPAAAIPGVRAAIDLELARWRAMFAGGPAAGPPPIPP